MEACIVICRSQKAEKRQGKVLFIDAVEEISRERSISFLEPEHQKRIADVYQSFTDETGFGHIATIEEISDQDYSLSIPLHVKRNSNGNDISEDARNLRQIWAEWEQNGMLFWQEMEVLGEMLDKIRNSTSEQ